MLPQTPSVECLLLLFNNLINCFGVFWWSMEKRIHKKADINSSLVVSAHSWRISISLTPFPAEEGQALL